MTDAAWTSVEVTGGGMAPMVLVCENASRVVPPELEGLGLDEAAQVSHVTRDVGALPLARRPSKPLGAPLVAGAISRLVYDCNRPVDAPDAIAARSEVFDIPGKRDFDGAARKARHDRVHLTFHAALADTCVAQTERCGRPITLVTIHSFAPAYLGQQPCTDIGFLPATDAVSAVAALAAEQARGIWRAAFNEPYAASDGVTHTLILHGDTNGRSALMIEVRNDLIATRESAASMADHLAQTLLRALPRIAPQGAT